MTKLRRLEEQYRAHHGQSRTSDFVFGGEERAAIFREWVGTGKRVLDVGCRYGALTRAYVEGNEVVGVDVDSAALAEAAGSLGIETLVADAEEPLPFGDASFDVVVAGEVLEHLRFVEHALDEVHRVLRPGGALVGSIPNAYRLKNRLEFLRGRPPDFAGDPTHLRLYSGDDLRRLLARFEDVELRYFSGRLVAVHPRLFANILAFRARKRS